MSVPLPKPIVKFFSHFPLYSYPPISPPRRGIFSGPALWIHPPRGSQDDLLSSDVECLKWQAYLALRGLTDIVVRWDISAEGGIDGRLPNLQDGEELLAAHIIPGWVDAKVGLLDPLLEGYRDEPAKDESRAWVSLMEGSVHAALVRFSYRIQSSWTHFSSLDPVPTSSVTPALLTAARTYCPGSDFVVTTACAIIRPKFSFSTVRYTRSFVNGTPTIPRSDCIPFRTSGYRQMVSGI
jgi:hypothetical protein